MKLLFFTDIHLHNYHNFGLDSKTGLYKRLVEQQSVLNQIVDIVIKRKLDGVVFGGDLFHSVGSVSTEVLNTAYTFFKYLEKNNIPIYLVKGNHDLINRKNPKWFHYSGKVFDSGRSLDKIKLIDFNEAIDYDKIKGYKVVVIHQVPINAKVGNFEFKEGFNWQELAKNNDLVMCGHIHQRQELAPNCIVMGAPMHLTFGDKGDRGCYVVDVDNGSCEFIKLDSPQFKTVDNVEDVKEDGNYYRVLNATSNKINKDNVIVSTAPVDFKERIKSQDFRGILKEWLELNNQPLTHLDTIKDLLTDEKLQSLGNQIFKGRLDSVEIEDFLSIKNIKYNVENGFILVTGTNDIFDSNGSGKTTLFDAIYWCLSGKTTKGLTGNDVIRNRPTQQEDCQVTLKFGTLVISRSRKNGLSILDSDNDLAEGLKQDERQRRLESILGFNATLFLSSCYFSQENIMMLTSLSSTEKTTLITNILGFDSYEDLYTRIAARIKAAEQTKEHEYLSEITRTNFSIKQNTSNIDIFKKQLLENQESILNSTNLINNYKDKIKELKPTKTEAPKEIDYSKIIISHEEEGIGLVNSIKNNLAILENLRDSKHALLNNNTKVITEKTALDKELNELEVGIKELQAHPLDAKCDKCGAVVTSENINGLIQEKGVKLAGLINTGLDLENQKTALGVQINTIGEEIDKVNASQKELNINLEKCRENIKDLNNKKHEQSEKIHLLEREKEQYTADIKEYTNLIKVYEEKISEFKVKNNNIDKEINTLIDKNNGQNIIILELNNKIKELDNQIEILKFWKDAFSSTGIRPLLLDRFCNDFNKIVNGYLTDISAGKITISLSPTSTTKAGEERNSIDMKINLDNKESKYISLSGGEKRRVDSSLCFGLNRYITEMKQLGKEGLLGLIILDEVFGGLDKTGEDNLAMLLCREGRNKAVFVIDHALDLFSYSDRIWVVNKKNSISNLEINES